MELLHMEPRMTTKNAFVYTLYKWLQPERVVEEETSFIKANYSHQAPELIPAVRQVEASPEQPLPQPLDR